MFRYVYFLRRVERILNQLGYFPIVGTVTGLFRILFALGFQWATGLVCFMLGLIAAMVTRAIRLPDASERCIWLAQSGKLLQVRTGFNLWRGLFEIVPVIGGITCFLYDKTMGGVPLIEAMDD
jgi:hypothetical protein